MDDGDDENRDEAGECLATENLRARERRHLQAHERSVCALGDQAQTKGHHAADETPDHPLRKRDVERVLRPTTLTRHRRLHDLQRLPFTGAATGRPLRSGRVDEALELAEEAFDRSGFG